MKVNNNNSGANDVVRLDPQAGGAAFIDTWRIVSGTGGLLEEIIHYNAVYSLMTDLTGQQHTLSTLALTDGSIQQLNAVTAMGTESMPISGAEGTADAAITGATSIAKSSNYTFTHTPMSGLFQTDRLVPFGFANGTAYVEIVLPTAQFPLASNDDSPTTAALSWTITDVELNVPVLRMGAEFNASFRELLSSGMPISWHGQSFSNVQSVIPNGGAGQQTVTLASRKRSVKSIFSIFRKQSDMTSGAADSSSARQGGAVTQWSYEIGGIQYPVAPVQSSATNVGETYSHLIRCLNNLGNSYAGTTMNRATFLTTDAVSKVAYGLDLESYGHSDVQSGKNLSGQGLPIVFRPTMNPPADLLLDCYLLHDVVYTLDGVSGTITAAS